MSKPIGDGLTPQKRYAKKVISRIVVDLNGNTDGDILTHLGTVSNRQGYIKSLIRADIKAKYGGNTK